MTLFEQAWELTGKAEGGYSNNPDDHGGETNWGITALVARRYGYTGSMRDLPRPRAKEIAKKAYWDVMKLDQIAALSEPIAAELFDSGFNSGPMQAVIWLQRTLNALNRDQKDYPDQSEDGRLGPLTISALKTFLKARGADGELVMLRALNGLQLAFLVGIKQETFLFGWILNRVRI